MRWISLFDSEKNKRNSMKINQKRKKKESLRVPSKKKRQDRRCRDCISVGKSDDRVEGSLQKSSSFTESNRGKSKRKEKKIHVS